VCAYTFADRITVGDRPDHEFEHAVSGGASFVPMVQSADLVVSKNPIEPHPSRNDAATPGSALPGKPARAHLRSFLGQYVVHSMLSVE
jgi:hypothetical protein